MAYYRIDYKFRYHMVNIQEFMYVMAKDKQNAYTIGQQMLSRAIDLERVRIIKVS